MGISTYKWKTRYRKRGSHGQKREGAEGGIKKVLPMDMNCGGRDAGG